jgi:peptidoglycan hydrolase-like protein with peptidoglycan-binding domain
MSNKCMIIGVDGYEFKPLTSAVNDALAFSKKLLSTGIFAESEVDFFLSPNAESKLELPKSVRAATADEIRDYLKGLYRTKLPPDRFLLYFAGHGVSAWIDAAQSKLANVIIPSNVRSVEDDGNRLINFDDLRDRFKMRGPLEQFYIIDACRDLGWERNPDVPGMGWAAQPDDAPRRQATLFAVAPRGQALGREGQLGVMTSHLLDALDGKGSALDSVVENGQRQYAVTIQSIHEYVHRRVEKQLIGLPAWKLYFTLPMLDAPDPKTEPLRANMTAPECSISVMVDPTAAEPAIEAAIDIFGHEIGRAPPFRSKIKVAPTLYEVSARAVNSWGRWQVVDPHRRVVDAREEQVVTIDVIDSKNGAVAGAFEASKVAAVTVSIAPVDGGLINPWTSFKFADPIIPPNLSLKLRSRRKDEVKLVQYMLVKSGHARMKVDGSFGPVTRQALRAFQSHKAKITPTGTVDFPTWGALQAKTFNALDPAPFRNIAAGLKMPWTSRSFEASQVRVGLPKYGIGTGSKRKDLVRSVQYLTSAAGVAPLEIDGHYGEITESAVRVFQKHASIPVTGRVDARTWQSLRERVADLPGVILPTAADPGIVVEMEALDGNRAARFAHPGERVSLPAGPYRISFKLGGEPLNESRIVLGPGEFRSVAANAERGEALDELITPAELPGVEKRTYEPSEKIGPMQGAVLSTLLPLISLKAFEKTDEILHRLNLDVPKLERGKPAAGHIAVTIALEGKWMNDPSAVLKRASISCSIASSTESKASEDIGHPILLQPRTGIAILNPGPLVGCGSLRIAIPGSVDLDIATCVIGKRVTCVGLVVHGDGQVELVQSLLLPPGARPEARIGDPPTPQRIVRLLALAARVYGDRSHQQEMLKGTELDQLEYGKWTDPLLGVLAWLTRYDDLEGEQRFGNGSKETLRIVATNLNKYFSDVPDVKVIGALRGDISWPSLFNTTSALPLFSATTRLFAQQAIEYGKTGHPVVERARTLLPGSVWNMVVKPDMTTSNVAPSKREEVRRGRRRAL